MINKPRSGIWCVHQPLRAVAFACIFLLSACTQVTKTHQNPFPIDRSEYKRVFRASVQVLRDHGFTVARADYRYGNIHTAPLISSTLLEPWNDINSTSDQAIESTLNEQRRRIAIVITPDTSAGTQQIHSSVPYGLLVRVQEQRHRLPRRHLTGSTRGGRIFALLNSVPTEYRALGISNDYWETVGRDEWLEQRIMADIVRRSMTLPPNDPTQPTTTAPG